MLDYYYIALFSFAYCMVSYPNRCLVQANIQGWNEPFNTRNLQCEIFRKTYDQEQNQNECKYGKYEFCGLEVCLQGPGQVCNEKPTSQLKCKATLLCNCGRCVGCTATRECYFDDMCPKRRNEIKRSGSSNLLNQFTKWKGYYQ